MSYSKLFLSVSLFFCTTVVAIEPQELLAQWKAMAQEERIKEIERCKKASEDHESANMRIYYSKEYKDWQTRTRLDHITVRYYEKEKGHRKVYIQLECSKYCSPFGFSDRYYNFNQKTIDEVLKGLMENLPLDKTPYISVRQSKKRRIEKRFCQLVRGIFSKEIEVCDLYSVTIDYT